MKTAADVYMPCDGKVVRVNNQLEDEPQKISIAAEDDGWLMEMEINDTAQLDDLLDEYTYMKHVENEKEDH